MYFRGIIFFLVITPVFSFIEDAHVTLADRKAVSLSGFWNFSANGQEKRLRVEKEWRLQGVSNVARGTFTLGIDIPHELRTGDFALILPPVSAAVKIFVNGRLVAEKGRVDKVLRYPYDSSEAFAWYPVKTELLLPQQRQILSLEITGFYGGGGIYGNAHIYFGGQEAVREKYGFLFLTTAFLAAAIFMIAVFHFALVSDKNYRRANLHYVLLSLAMSAHILGMNGLGYYLWNNFLFNAALIHLIVAAFPFALTGFTLRYFRLQYPFIRRLAYYYGALMALFLVFVAVLPQLIPFYLNIGLPFGVALMALSLVFAIFGAVQGALRETDGAKLVLVGLMTYGTAVINDVVFYFFHALPYKLADAGFLVAVVCVALALAQRLQRSAAEKEELRDWKKEIALAAQIQNLALPQRKLATPHLRVATLFKPMKIIGGDFFAFHEISEKETGIFIADVSGHGIAAALLVNTIRSVFYQQREYARNPAELLQRMNRALYPHLQEQFITAAYCVLDFAAGKIRLAQAGHPPVYLIRNDGCGFEKLKPKGRFFGFAEELQYEVLESDLSGFSRIFLYSDGVIEAGAIAGHAYSTQRLENFLLRTAGDCNATMLAGLEEEIRRLTGSGMNTDDDSSCVVADFALQA